MKEDCTKNFKSKLIEDRVLQKQDIGKIEERVYEEIEEAMNFACESPSPEDSELIDDLYM